ncbi:MAG: hypothetical protein SFY92_10020 [Verrucomicrobiae bacterium]|nr:hypothetical protein [Verrucomicrobiae bacterium]
MQNTSHSQQTPSGGPIVSRWTLLRRELEADVMTQAVVFVSLALFFIPPAFGEQTKASIIFHPQWEDTYSGEKNLLFEIYVENKGKEAQEIESIEYRGDKKYVVWSQVYPKKQIASMGFACIQFCLENSWMDAEGKLIKLRVSGKDYEIQIPPYQPQWLKIRSVAPTLDQKKILMAVEDREGKGIKKISFNGKETGGFSSFKVADKTLVEVDAGSSLRETYLLIQIDTASQKRFAALKPLKAFSIDAFGLKDEDIKTRIRFQLDMKRLIRQNEIDVTCIDADQKKPGFCAEKVLNEYALSAADREELVATYACTSATVLDGYNIYCRITDAFQIAPYSRQFSFTDNFIKREDWSLNNAKQAVAYRPFGLIVETFIHKGNGRPIVPDEIEQVIYSAIGRGAKSIKYFSYASDPQGLYRGLDMMPELEKKILEINAFIRKNEAIFFRAVPVTGPPYKEGGFASFDGEPDLYLMWIGGKDFLLIVKNTLYEKRGEEHRRKLLYCVPKQDVKIEVKALKGKIQSAIDLETYKKLKIDGDQSVKIDELKCVRFIILKTKDI